ncbi:PhzF family phenazine biosynthesis protein [Flagellimonas aequoris]|uniref:PhzF family phenazine biosynthesis protein n=1 Tax=Flagellimonas aequoris TaxID=2306997 RepID=A0A418NAS6_9FLAO|nr:PhzF family phenazine biosynthesis protein [Allomuricauda aequoris]RIV72889.1 PhzF family phenazine biosynthesis protein [Allomuricauda aequoris]TXK05396.1 PhzF family phenazine biosynthesis protein [Allomuricauda aequoris]
MRQKIYQIDAFTSKTFGGNPAAVCILEKWLEAELMQKIAQENNLAETAFAVKKDGIYELRWFTPEVEVDLCGHATIATAYVLFHYYELKENTIRFYSPRSGELTVEKAANGWLTLDFPTDHLVGIQNLQELDEAIGAKPIKTFKGKTDYMLIYNNQQEVESIQPNHHLLSQLDVRGVIVTAPGSEVDFVSRFFAPACGIPEDPVTGSAHTSLTPYWSEVLQKTKMTAKQLSKRQGDLVCEYLGERVKISGKAAPYLFGEIEI